MSGFDLITSPEQLPIAQVRSAGNSWQSFLPTSSAVGDNFSSGQITIPWSISSPNWWDPRKSYLRVVVRTSYCGPLLVNPDDTGTNKGSPFLPYMGIAPAFLQGQSLFSRASISFNNVIVSQFSDNGPQIGAFMHRVTKAAGQDDSFEDSLDFTNPNFAARQQTVTVPAAVVPQVGDNDQTVCLFDIVPWYPGPAQSVTVEFKDNETCEIKATAGLANSWPTVLAYLKQGMLVTVLETPASVVIGTAVIDTFAASDANTLSLRVRNITGGNFAELGANGKPPTILFTSLVPRKPICNTYELCVQPALSVFQSGQFIPGGSYTELQLVPYPASVFQQRAIESLGANKVAGRDFQVEILDISMQVYCFSGPRVDSSLSFLWPLEMCVDVGIQAITSAGSNSFIVNVQPSTYVIAIALQSRSAGQSSQSSATRFTVGYPSNSQGLEKSLTRLLVTYRSSTQPASLQSLGYKGYSKSVAINPPADAGANLNVLRYMQDGLINGLGLTSGGFEDFQRWQEAGQLFLFYFPSDASADSNRCQVTLQTDQDLTGSVPGSVGANVLVFSVSRQLATVTMDGGRWTSVNVTNM